MAQLTVAMMRAVARELVMDTNTNSPGLADSDWLVLLNDALFGYAEMFPDSLALSGLLASLAFTVNTKSATLPLLTTPPVSRNVTGAFLRNTGSLDQKSPLDILRMQVDEATVGVPSKFSLESLLPGQVTGNSYIMRLHPIPDGSYTVDVYGTSQPTALTGDSDYTVFQDAESRIIARMAAVEGARLLGRSDSFIAGVAAPLADRVKAHVLTVTRDVNPRPYPGKPVA